MSTERRLYVLRHAKSSWDDPRLRDDERPLSPRGVAATEALSRHFLRLGLQVELVLCSPAVRTRQTWAGVRDAVGGEPEVRIEPAVYEASAATLLRLLHRVQDAVGSVLFVGHNPGSSALVGLLSEDVRGTELPTGGFATLAFDTPWSGLVPGGARLVDLVRPRELD